MATKKPDPSNEVAALAAARNTDSSPANPAAVVPEDAASQKMTQTQELAAAMPLQREQGRSSTAATTRCIRRDGATVEPPSPAATGSTLSRRQRLATRPAAWRPKASTPPSSRSTACASIRAARCSRPTRACAIADNQNSLKAGLRGPTLLEDFILREKITHFDHERIPERIVHARGSGAHGYFECYEPLTDITTRGAVRGGRQAHAGVRALLDRGRRARLDRHGARRARLRGQVLHRRRQLGPGRQQHPGVLHPGRDEVPRPRPRGQARAAPRHAAGRERARHLLGLRLADARVDAHADVGDVATARSRAATA